MTISFNNNMKPSELVLVFRDVMDIAINSGCKMDLFEWESLNGNLPCLGGLKYKKLTGKGVNNASVMDMGFVVKVSEKNLVN